MEGQTVPVSWTASINATGYILQRKADTDEDWTQVYSGQALSSSETAGAWSWVQYRVKATGEKADSAWATSGEIPVVSASALVISGQDGDLGTLVNDVPYSVSSDTGNQISLELRVNGALWTALEVSSGYAQSIPVIDLPTGAGTIDILATVQASTGAVSAARAWTYTQDTGHHLRGPLRRGGVAGRHRRGQVPRHPGGGGAHPGRDDAGSGDPVPRPDLHRQLCGDGDLWGG